MTRGDLNLEPWEPVAYIPVRHRVLSTNNYLGIYISRPNKCDAYAINLQFVNFIAISTISIIILGVTIYNENPSVNFQKFMIDLFDETDTNHVVYKDTLICDVPFLFNGWRAG